jgi:hypothetical protein
MPGEKVKKVEFIMPKEFCGEKPVPDDLVKLCSATFGWAEVGKVLQVQGFRRTKVTLVLKNSPDKPRSTSFTLNYVPNDWTFRQMKSALDKLESVDKEIRHNIINNLRASASCPSDR